MTGTHSGNLKQKSILLAGFDSAWTANNSGGLVGVLRPANDKIRELGPPQIVDYHQAEVLIAAWQADLAPTSTIVLLDQPTIVPNATGQRPV
jgi:predicted RNase H-like nuclease